MFVMLPVVCVEELRGIELPLGCAIFASQREL